MIARDAPSRWRSNYRPMTLLTHTPILLFCDYMSNEDIVDRFDICINTLYPGINHLSRHQSFIQAPIIYPGTNHLSRHQSFIQTPIIYPNNNHLSRHQSFIHAPIIYPGTNHLSRHQSFIQAPISYPGTNHYRHQSFIQQPIHSLLWTIYFLCGGMEGNV